MPTLAIDTDDFLAACTPPTLSESEILDCFNATPVADGRGGYLVAVGRAIERKALAAVVAGNLLPVDENKSRRQLRHTLGVMSFTVNQLRAEIARLKAAA